MKNAPDYSPSFLNKILCKYVNNIVLLFYQVLQTVELISLKLKKFFFEKSLKVIHKIK